tara:strand:- start:485 stop:787 length:303 start_codon:yes stop_codon:yes gene_type:complete
MPVRSTTGGDRVTAFNYCSIYTAGSSSIRDSYNTSSITEHNGSTYQVTFSTAAGNSNYCPVVNCDVETNQWISNIGSSYYRMRTGGNLGSSVISGIVFQN